MAESELFNRHEKSPGWARLLKWHKELIDPRADRGLQAELRRCRTPDEAMVTRAFQRLWASLGAPQLGNGEPDITLARRLALACAALSHVKQNDSANHFAALLGQAKTGQSEPRMSLARLRRLFGVEATEPDKLLAELIRAIRLAGETANVKSLAIGAMHWDDTTRRDWTFRYYGASIPASGNTSDETSGD
ncbi:MAG: type I-E CRISPR-associated protein Cse2/CasB [Acidobacteriota bacterium]